MRALARADDSAATSRGRRWPLPLAALAAICYSSWLLAPIFSPLHDPVRSYVSELAASKEPKALFYQLMDLTAGAAIYTACILVIWCDRPGWKRAMPFVLLGCFGLVTIIDALLPLSCTPTSDQICALEESLGLVPLAHQLHLYSSTTVGLLGAATVMWTSVYAWRHQTPAELRVGGLVLAVVHLLTLGWTTLAALDVIGVGLGVAQRISLMTLTIWWVLLFTLWHRSPGRGLPEA